MKRVLITVVAVLIGFAIYSYKPTEQIVITPSVTPTVSPIKGETTIETCHNDNNFILKEINEERSKRGISKLTLSIELNTSAQGKNEHMKNNDYWEHVSPSGVAYFDFINEVGYTNGAENLAMGYSCDEERMKAWMLSPKHAQNILEPRLQDIGIDRMVIDNQVSIVTHFGTN